MSETSSVSCYFWDKTSETPRNPNNKCQGDASGFVRIKHSGRLCPLCSSCKETFTRAQSEMKDDVKSSIPGKGEFEEVALSPESVSEYAAQPAKAKQASAT
jgi:hypothetical protein